MKRTQGFTLFEVLTAIAIFMLLAGGIFAAVRAAFVTSVQVGTAQLDSERSDAFQQLMRRFFQSLPADAKVELRLRKQAGRGDVVEVLAWPVPPFLRFGTAASDGIAITGLPDGRGNFRISLGYFRAEDTPEERDRRLETASWLTLLPDVREVQWRFAPARNPVLVEKWNAGSGRPGLAELTLDMADGSTGTYAYWVPILQRRSSTSPVEDPGGAPGTPPPPTDPGAVPPVPEESEEAEAPSPP